MKLYLTAIVLGAATLLAQTSPEVEITAEPHHHLALQNAYIRVFQVVIPPGEATLMHRHHHDYVHVTLCACQLSREIPGKPPEAVTRKSGETGFSEGNFAHVVRNVGSIPFHAVDIEFLQDGKEPKSPAARRDEDRGLNVLQGGTQDILFVKDGVRVSDIELQPHGMVPKQPGSGPRLIVAVSDVSLSGDGKQADIQLKPGEIKWLAGGSALMNKGPAQGKFVMLEFH